MYTYIKKNWWWMVTAAIFVIPGVALYIYVLHPILGTPFMNLKEYRGAEYYESGKYLEFEKGSVFRETLDSYEFLKDCQVTDFYYSDSRYKDSFVYGKRPDVYGVVLDPGENYGEIKAIIAEIGYFENTLNSWEPEKATDVYAITGFAGKDTPEFLFIVGHDVEYLSFIMVTETTKQERKKTYDSLIGVVHFWSPIPFDTP